MCKKCWSISLSVRILNVDSSAAVYSKKEKKDLGTWGRKSRWKIEGPGDRVTHRAGGGAGRRGEGRREGLLSQAVKERYFLAVDKSATAITATMIPPVYHSIFTPVLVGCLAETIIV